MWFWLTVLAGTASTGHHLIDRFILRKEKDPVAFAFLFQLLTIVLILPILLFDFKVSLALKPVLLLLLMGIVDVMTIVLMVYMHRYVETSISSTFVRLRMVWALILAAIFLGERITGSETVGVGLIFLGLLVVSYQYQRLSKETQLSLKK